MILSIMSLIMNLGDKLLSLEKQKNQNNNSNNVEIEPAKQESEEVWTPKSHIQHQELDSNSP